jgi:hypothetical protein
VEPTSSTLLRMAYPGYVRLPSSRVLKNPLSMRERQNMTVDKLVNYSSWVGSAHAILTGPTDTT